MNITVAKIKNGKVKKSVKLEMDMRDCIEIPLKNNRAVHNRARLKENLRKSMEER